MQYRRRWIGTRRLQHDLLRVGRRHGTTQNHQHDQPETIDVAQLHGETPAHQSRSWNLHQTQCRAPWQQTLLHHQSEIPVWVKQHRSDDTPLPQTIFCRDRISTTTSNTNRRRHVHVERLHERHILRGTPTRRNVCHRASRGTDRQKDRHTHLSCPVLNIAVSGYMSPRVRGRQTWRVRLRRCAASTT